MEGHEPWYCKLFLFSFGFSRPAVALSHEITCGIKSSEVGHGPPWEQLQCWANINSLTGCIPKCKQSKINVRLWQNGFLRRLARFARLARFQGFLYFGLIGFTYRAYSFTCVDIPGQYNISRALRRHLSIPICELCRRCVRSPRRAWGTTIFSDLFILVRNFTKKRIIWGYFWFYSILWRRGDYTNRIIMLIVTGPSSERNIMFLSDERPTLDTFDFTIRIGNTPIFLYFDFYLNATYTQHSLFHKT